MISMHRRTRAVTRALRRGSFTVLATLAVVTALSCRDALKVEDPQTFSNTDLDNPLILPSVANGVEGQFQQVFDDVVVSTALLSDEVINSSTWIDWADISTGRLRGDWATQRASVIRSVGSTRMTKRSTCSET